MTRPARKPSFLHNWGLALVALTALGLVAAIWGAAAAGGAITGQHQVDGNPFGYLLQLALGQRQWPGTPATLILIALAVLLIVVTVLLVMSGLRRHHRANTAVGQIDRTARQMRRANDLAGLAPAGVAASARRLRPTSQIDPADPAQHGRLIGNTVVDNVELRVDWESLEVDIWGPRRGKTTTLTIPRVVEAPGPVLATSNKRDLVDATRGPRGKRGRVWTFDPQQVANEPAGWWYNPLSRISGINDAMILTSHFAMGTRNPDAKTDAYFDNAAEGLLGNYLLAAALGDKSLLDVYGWISNSRDRGAYNLLVQAGQEQCARDVNSVLEAPEKQRSGVFDTAKTLLQCLRDPGVAQWVTPPTDSRPEFHPEHFVESTDTLYLLSIEGAGSSAPLVAALTEHVCHAAVQAGSRSPGGRLDPPLYAALDEAANVCKWRELPNLYSHFGSRGVVVDTILQSWAQGEEVWGRGGMEKLWGAANVRTYGGGAADPQFLRRLSDMVGPQDWEKWSFSIDSSGRRSHSAQGHRYDRLGPAELFEMPPGRVLVLAGAATIVRSIPWMTGPHAGEIELSLATYDPGARTP